MKRLMFLTVFALGTSSIVVAQNYAGPVNNKELQELKGKVNKETKM